MLWGHQSEATERCRNLLKGGCKVTAHRTAYADGNIRCTNHLADVEDRTQQLLEKEGQGRAAKSNNRGTIRKRDNGYGRGTPLWRQKMSKQAERTTSGRWDWGIVEKCLQCNNSEIISASKLPSVRWRRQKVIWKVGTVTSQGLKTKYPRGTWETYKYYFRDSEGLGKPQKTGRGGEGSGSTPQKQWAK